GALRLSLEKIPDSDFDRLQEIRLRVNRPLSVFSGEFSGAVNGAGHIGYANGGGAAAVTVNDLKFTFESICQFSVHSFKREIASGFVTVAGGHRAGFCGTAVTAGLSEIETVKNISGINFRIARQIKGAADELFTRIYAHSPKTPSVLICGSPGSGKTTLLRDLARQLGNRIKTSVIDERGEISAVWSGIPGNDPGAFTDIFDGYPKTVGIETAVRVMSPQVIICDEIGGVGDIEAINYAKNSGCAVVAAIHADSAFAVAAKGITADMFDFTVFLNGADKPATVKEIIGTEAITI
ncbi:MAG: Flp pilus assembly complex ATPase component TadA, partial [Ruminococcus sp.]|nr:Flp pilus assembly complex ATPase component TadA [Ruminococcus sp.]